MSKKEGKLKSHGESNIGIQCYPRSLTSSSFTETLSNSITSTRNSLLSYLPSALPKSLPLGEESTKPKIVWAQFQSFHFNRTWSEKDKTRDLYLILGLIDGIQVWDLCTLDDVKMIFSVKAGPVRCSKILHNPIVKQEPDQWCNSRPHLAIVCGESNQPPQQIKIYSLLSGEAVNVLRMKQEIFFIDSNSHVMIAGTRDQIHAFDLRTYKNEFHISLCEPNPHSGACVATLGPRWIAYATSKPSQKLSVSKMDKDANETTASSLDTAKVVASNILYWGDKSIQAVSGYFSGNQEKSNGQPTTPQAHGTVSIRDVTNRTQIATFQCHENPLSEIVFNESGSLIATADCYGQEINVFQILPSLANDLKRNHIHLYKLFRGTSSAIIESISFNTDSKWLTVCSARGTTHIFPITLVGEVPDVETHAGVQFYEKATPKYPIQVNAVGRIHQTPCIPFDEQEQTKMGLSWYKMPVRAKILNSFEEVDIDNLKFIENVFAFSLLTMSPFGTLTFSILQPVSETIFSNNQELKELKLKIMQTLEWNLMAVKQATDLKIKIQNQQKSREEIRTLSSVKWLSNVEVTTFEPKNKPIWSNTQFTFMRYQPIQDKNMEDLAIIRTDLDLNENDTPSSQFSTSKSEPIPYVSKKEDMRSAFMGSLEYVSPSTHGINFENDALLLGTDVYGYDSVDNCQSDIGVMMVDEMTDLEEEKEEINIHSHNIQSPDGDNELDAPSASIMVERH